VIFAIEMLLDSVADARVRQLWRRIAERGLPSPLLALGHSPHVSLAVADGLDVEAFLPELRVLLAREPAPRTALASAATFGTREGVIYLGAVATRALLDFHARFFPAFERAAGKAWPYYRPDAWVPHCTVTSGLAPAQVGDALALCADAGLPIPVTLEGVAVVENPTGKVHARLPFGPPS
jgi:2'-5' RNA ligase superfamily protein